MAEAAEERGAATPTPVESGIGEGMLEWSLLVNNKTARNYWAAIKSQTLLNPWDELSDLIFTKALCDTYYHYIHFRDRKTEVQRI